MVTPAPNQTCVTGNSKSRTGKEVMRMANNCGCKTKPKGPKTVPVKPHKRSKPRKCS